MKCSLSFQPKESLAINCPNERLLTLIALKRRFAFCDTKGQMFTHHSSREAVLLASVLLQHYFYYRGNRFAILIRLTLLTVSEIETSKNILMN